MKQLFLVLALCGLAAPAWTADRPGKKAGNGAKTDPAQEAMMAKWKEAAMPDENHRVLDPLAGSWDHAMEWWMPPGAPPEKSTGTTNVKWIMGGRYIQQSVTGVSMGQPFEGAGITGYDNVRKQYVSAWIDNMGTGLMTATGAWDPAAQTLTERGTFSDPMSPTGEKTFRGVTTFRDGGHTFEMYAPGPDGRETA
jgi:hypothetical protein